MDGRRLQWTGQAIGLERKLILIKYFMEIWIGLKMS
jgi:hypothetical protein